MACTCRAGGILACERRRMGEDGHLQEGGGDDGGVDGHVVHQCALVGGLDGLQVPGRPLLQVVLLVLQPLQQIVPIPILVRRAGA